MAQLIHPDIPGSFQQGRQYAQRNALADMQLGQATRDNYETNQVGNILSTVGQVQPGQQQNYINSLMSQGQQGMQAAGKVAEMFKGMSEQQRAAARQRIEDGARILATVRDPQSYAFARQQLIQQNPNVADKFPEQYNPQFVEMKLNEARSISEVLGGGAAQPAGIQEFNYISKIISNPEQYPKDVVNAARIKAGLDPRSVGSSDITIADKGLTEPVGTSKANIAGKVSGAQEEAKLLQQGIHKPRIEAAIAQAKVEAQARGEAITELQMAQAALPGLEDVIGSLKQLAPLATNTAKGKLWNLAVKELGFGSTRGATARAEFISIVDNQVLPLLKQTFGAAFTVQEGENLKATLGDPDSSPDEKMVQLEAFIQNKYREIETKQRYLNSGAQQPVNSPQPAATPQPDSGAGKVINWSDM